MYFPCRSICVIVDESIFLLKITHFFDGFTPVLVIQNQNLDAATGHSF
jgi:hypothetical protein